MSHPEICAKPLPFGPNDPYAWHLYKTVLIMLLDAGPEDTELAERVAEQREQARPVIGDRLAELVTVHAIIDDLDVRIPDLELQNWHS